MRFLIVVPAFNRADLLDRCLASIMAQDDPAFDVVVADDASTDPEVIRVMGVAARDQMTPGTWLSFSRDVNVGATRNIVEAIRSVPMSPSDVVLLVDGDDRLPHPGVISRLREVYENDVELSYGSYEPDPPDPGCPAVRPYPTEVLESGTIRAFTRTHGVWFNHPISFRRRLFDAIADSEFKRDGEWMRYSYDTSLMMPLIELAGTRVRYLDEILYTYTSDRDDSDGRAHSAEVSEAWEHVMAQPRRHLPL